jgi:hypothetical protein
MYEQLLHSFGVYLQEKWTVSKSMKARERSGGYSTLENQPPEFQPTQKIQIQINDGLN